jgi:hypothetical protein
MPGRRQFGRDGGGKIAINATRMLQLLRSALEHSFKIGQGAGIIGLAEPEHGLFTNSEVCIAVGNVDQLRHALIFRQLA